jgi:hypothetical protein
MSSFNIEIQCVINEHIRINNVKRYNLASTEKKRRFILFCLLGLALAAGIVIACFLLFTP